MIPEKVLRVMASAMLDPAIRVRLRYDTLGGQPPPEMTVGNKVRVEVLERALEAARQLGWEMGTLK